MKKISDKQKLKNELKKEETRKLHSWFLSLWEELPSNKKCIECGSSIYGECLSTYFDHLLEKSKYPELALEINNLYYPICGDCHSCKTNGFPKEKHREAIKQAKIKFDV